MSPVDIGVPCLNVRAKVLFCTVLRGMPVTLLCGRLYGQFVDELLRQLSSLYFKQSANHSVAHKIFQSVSRQFPQQFRRQLLKYHQLTKYLKLLQYEVQLNYI